MSTATVTNGSLAAPDPMAAFMASLQPADLSLFAKTVAVKVPNEYLPAVKLSNEGRNVEGVGAPYQFPCTFGDSQAVAAKMRRAGRELGLSLQTRWAPSDQVAYDGACTAVAGTAALADDAPVKVAAVGARDGSPGVLVFRTVPQVKRDRATGQEVVQ